MSAFLVAALRKIRSESCENYTSGLGSCYLNGRTEDAQFGADLCCHACIADAALTAAELLPLADLQWDDVHRAMRSYGHEAKQEPMRRALASFLTKRDVLGMYPFTLADGHRVIG